RLPDDVVSGGQRRERRLSCRERGGRCGGRGHGGGVRDRGVGERAWHDGERRGGEGRGGHGRLHGVSVVGSALPPAGLSTRSDWPEDGPVSPPPGRRLEPSTDKRSQRGD